MFNNTLSNITRYFPDWIRKILFFLGREEDHLELRTQMVRYGLHGDEHRAAESELSFAKTPSVPKQSQNSVLTERPSPWSQQLIPDIHRT